MKVNRLFCIKANCKEKSCKYNQSRMKSIERPCIIDLSDMSKDGDCVKKLKKEEQLEWK